MTATTSRKTDPKNNLQYRKTKTKIERIPSIEQSKNRRLHIESDGLALPEDISSYLILNVIPWMDNGAND